MTTLCSYDLNGKQLSFANWISNLSPQETPFSSMTGKESINQTLFQWQTDTLSHAGKNAQVEGATAVEDGVFSTQVKSNITQILRKVVKVSDTANALANYGRGKELQYQMEKAGKELKRDVEWALLNNIKQSEVGGARKTAGFAGLVAGVGVPDKDTGAIVHQRTGTDKQLKEEDIFKMTYNLYLAGSKANIIMFHPKHASFFSSLQEKAAGGSRDRIFKDTPKFSVYVSTVVDPLGQEYKLLPNRWMPEDKIFFFNASDWTQMILRAPNRTKLAKDGSYEKWMLEMEVGLRHRNPFASGILDIDKTNDPATANVWGTAKMIHKTGSSADQEVDLKTNPSHVTVKRGDVVKFKVKIQYTGSAAAKLSIHGAEHTIDTNHKFVLLHNGKEEGHWTLTSSDLSTYASSAVVQPVNDRELYYTGYAETKHDGEYRVVLVDGSGKELIQTATVIIDVQ